MTCSTISNFSVCDCSFKMTYIMSVWIALQAWEFLESYHSFNSHHLEIVEYPPQYNSTLCLQFFFNGFLPYIPAPEHGLDCCMCQESLHLSNNQFQKINVNKVFKFCPVKFPFCKSPSENCYIHLWTAMLESPFWSNLRGLKAVWACSPGESSIGSRLAHFLQKSLNI